MERKTGLEPATPTLARLCSTNWAISAINKSNHVKRRRLELPRHNCHYPLKVARLPIPPPLQHFKRLWIPCPRQDSNLHVVKHTHLKRARLPIPPLGLRSHPPVLVHSESRAENGTRTRDPDLGKVVLYQLSYFRSKIHLLGAFL